MSRKQKPPKEFKIKAAWDPEAQVWYVENSDIPGLMTEAATLESLSEKIGTMIPELLRMNDPEFFTRHRVPFRLVGERLEEIELAV
ncbi:MAG: hypothetical protein HW380_2396 [Magnetococcales bacterium]|nr:hypothetical protein [Magnetococcales bacterium]